MKNNGRSILAILVISMIAWGMWWEKIDVKPTRQMQGEVLGSMPKAIQPTLMQPLAEMTHPMPLQETLIKRIPTINPDANMPHSFWGPCTKCHLIRGGLPPGSQPATPIAKVLEQVSSIYKVGPPILPNSIRPHPVSGRCIKCHDILVYTQPK